ncbi:MAG: ribosomal protein L7/L12 [Armatimonadota bacterium]
MYMVTWTAKGPMMIATVKALRLALGLNLTEAVNFVEKVQLPFILLDGVDLSKANSIKELLSQVDSSVDITDSEIKQPMIFYRPDLLRHDPSYSDVKSPIMRSIYRLLNPRL